MSRETAPNFRELPNYFSCLSCKNIIYSSFYESKYYYCAEHEFEVEDAHMRICDDHKEWFR